MEIKTHDKINEDLCGTPIELQDGFSKVELTTTERMVIDKSGLVHGGFLFGLADYAAMIAVNHPNVVLGAAQVKFLKPIKAGDTAIAEAKVGLNEGKKRNVVVEVTNGKEKVFEGEFTCFVLEKHVLA